MAVEGGLAHQGDVVDIDAHRRTVQSRTDSAHVYRRGVTRSIVRHHKRGHEVGHVAQVAHAQCADFTTSQHVRAQRLLAQFQVLLVLCHHNDLVEVVNARRVGQCHHRSSRRRRRHHQACRTGQYIFFHSIHVGFHDFGCKGTTFAPTVQSQYIWIFVPYPPSASHAKFHFDIFAEKYSQSPYSSP